MKDTIDEFDYPQIVLGPFRTYINTWDGDVHVKLVYGEFDTLVQEGHFPFGVKMDEVKTAVIAWAEKKLVQWRHDIQTPEVW